MDTPVEFVKELLPSWVPNVGQQPGYRDVHFSSRMNWASAPAHDPAPQQLTFG